MKTEELESLLSATKAVLKIEDFKTAARRIFDEACKMTGAKSGYVALLSEDGAENEVLFLEAGGMECTVDPNLPMPIRGLRADAYTHNKVVWDNDFMNSEWVKFMPAGHVNLRNVMFSPLVIEGKTVGIMGIANKDGDFTERDASLAEAYGHFAAIALQNSRNRDELVLTVNELQNALEEIKTLRGIIPICSWCKKIRNDKGYWEAVESYVSDKTYAHFTHGVCNDCKEKLKDELKK